MFLRRSYPGEMDRTGTKNNERNCRGVKMMDCTKSRRRDKIRLFAVLYDFFSPVICSVIFQLCMFLTSFAATIYNKQLNVNACITNQPLRKNEAFSHCAPLFQKLAEVGLSGTQEQFCWMSFLTPPVIFEDT